MSYVSPADLAAMQPKGSPPFVRFVRVKVEDKNASKAAGRYISKEIDYAYVTPIGSKDIVKHKVTDWWPMLERNVAQGRMPREWLESFKKRYEMFCNGQELHVDGTPIKGWEMISEEQQELLINLNIVNVESLASLNDEGLSRIGMGAAQLKRKAQIWLEENRSQKREVETLQKENQELRERLEKLESLVGKEKRPKEKELAGKSL